MGEFDDQVAIMGDWMLPSPSPRTFFSSMMNSDVSSQPVTESGSGNTSIPPFSRSEQEDTNGNGDKECYNEARFGCDETSNSNAVSEPKVSSRGGLMERIAARAGFNAPKLNTQSMRPTDVSKKPDVRSPYLTIPPGLSPTTLLESPVFLSNSLAQPSPTTGKFLFGNYQDSTFMIDNPDKGKENNFEDINASSFAFKPNASSASYPYFNTSNKSFAGFGISAHSDTSVQRTEPPKPNPVNNSVLFQEGNFGKSHEGNNSFAGFGMSAHSDTSVQHTEPPKPDPVLFHEGNFGKSHEGNDGSNNLLPEQTHNSVGATEQSPPLDERHDDGDQRSGGDPNGGGSTAEDGYNWRKYGQKHVKGSEYPRSYYKCTHQNCPVKKKVERSHEGHITEIIYKGAHNHPKPPPNRRSNLGPTNSIGDMPLYSEQPGTGVTSDPVWLGLQNGGGWKPDNLEALSSAHLGQEFSNSPVTTFQAPSGILTQSGDGVDRSSTFSNDEDEDDRATHGSVSLGYDGEGDESESKRRRIETYAPEMSGATRAIREPRVVVQTTSEVDILDDGYRWRKYGQKVVKGNPNPRSYYKCTSAGCNVRKHVERASHDLKSVITTYEGKHNHDVPAARNSAHANSGGSNSHSTQQAPATSHIHRPEASQMRGNNAWFERPSMSSFGLPQGRPQLGPGPGFGYGMTQAGLASLGLSGLGPNQGRLPVLPQYMAHQQRPMNNMSYMVPKGEPKAEPVTETGLNSSNAAVYQQFMSQMPLGPHM